MFLQMLNGNIGKRLTFEFYVHQICWS